jgi:nucleotide-binding universal stress UspA family protein
VNPSPIFNQIKASNLSPLNKQISMHSGDLLNECSAKLNAKGIPNSTLLEKGDIKEVICQKAEELGVDMILLGGIEILKPQSVNIIKYVADNAVCSVAMLQEKNYQSDDLRHSSLVDNVDNFQE